MPAAKGKGGAKAKAAAKKSSSGNGVVPATAKRARSRGGRREAGINVAGSKKDNLPVAAANVDAPLQWGRQKARGADPGAEHVDKPQIRHVPEATDEENLGFESLLQLADAGVHLEKRGKKRAKNSGAANAKGGKAGGKKGQVDGGKGQVKKRGRGPNKVQESEEEREAKRLRRVQANRESARQTIRRKHEIFDDLSGRAKILEETNKTLRDQVNALYDEMKSLASKNTDLRNDIKVIAEEKGMPVPELPKQPETAPPPRMVPADGTPKPTRIAPKVDIGSSKPAAPEPAQPATVAIPVPQMWPPHAAFAHLAAAACCERLHLQPGPAESRHDVATGGDSEPVRHVQPGGDGGDDGSSGWWISTAAHVSGTHRDERGSWVARRRDDREGCCGKISRRQIRRRA